MLRRPTTKSRLHQRLEKAFPWMIFGIIAIGVFINAILTIQYRTEEHLAEKKACQEGTADLTVDCTVYFGPNWVGVEPVAENKTNLSEAP